MSLINDILRDLEDRRSGATPTDGLAGLSAVPRVATRRRSLRVAGLATMLVAGSAGAVWYNEAALLPATAPETPAKAPMAQTSIATVTAPAPVEVPAAQTRSTGRLLGLSSSLSQAPVRRVAAAPAAATPAKPKATVASAEPQQAPATQPSRSEPEPTPAPVMSVAEAPIDHLAAGLYALSQGDGAEAETNFRVLVSNDASDTDAWLNLAAAQRQQGKNAKAQGTLSDALAGAARPALIAQAIARDLLDRGSDAEALSILQGYRPTSPLDPIHDAYIAAVLQRVGQYGEAADIYRTVLAIRPEAADWWVGLAISEEALGRHQAAIKAYRRARNIGHLDDALARYTEQRIAAIKAGQSS
ncbi:MAG: tetratricopeptide repeat protein [Pseudomonadota bacterium]